MSLIYPHDVRDKTRTSIRRINELAAAAEKSAAQGLILPEATRQGIIRLTGTSDVSNQVGALTAISDELRKRHMDSLKEGAKDDFGAFCEFVSPEEPPESRWHKWLCDKLQAIEFDPSLNRFILNCPPGHAKPLREDTPVLMASGAWKRIDQIEVGDCVVSHNGSARRVSKVYTQGVLETVKITTAAGRVIHAAPDHPFLIKVAGRLDDHASGRFVAAMSLLPGDRLSVVGGLREPPAPGRYDTDLVRFAAYWSALGSTQRNPRGGGTALTNHRLLLTSRQRAHDAQGLATSLGLRFSIAKKRGGEHFDMRLYTADAEAMGDKLGLPCTAADRRVPAFLFEAGAGAIATYLKTFLALTATTPRRYAVATITVSLKSAGLADDLQRLLAVLGVNARIEPCDDEFGGKHLLVIRAADVETLIEKGVAPVSCMMPEFATKRVSYPSEGLEDAVVSVEIAEPATCYCLTVEHDHTFVAAGLAVHNSTYASRLFVAWRIGRNPRMKVIGGGHTQRFVENQFSKKIRGIIRTPAFKTVFPGVVIDHATSAADQWAIAGHGGEYAAKGAGQAVHGFRANFVVVDDPYAKIEIAESPTEREKIETWFTGDLGSRMLPLGKMFLIQTRFHEYDLTGYLEAMNPSLPEWDRWQIVCAPALCIDPETDVLGRQLGEVLWDYYDLNYFVTKRTEWKFQRFALVYQQIASAASEDSIAGQFRYYKQLPHKTDAAIAKAKAEGQVDDLGRGKPEMRDYFRRITQTVDCAAKTTQRADFSVVQVWGETHDRKHYLLHQERKKVNFNDLITMIEKTARDWSVDRILVEDKGQGTAYIQARGETPTQRRLAPAPLIPIDPGSQSKEFRFDEVSPLIEAGEVYLPETPEWVSAFLTEISQFPNGTHDDQVDAMTQYLRWAKTTRTKFGSRKIKSYG